MAYAIGDGHDGWTILEFRHLFEKGDIQEARKIAFCDPWSYANGHDE
ncbi:hypothetical protein [Beijerinckia indica]|nr:hypothetical protein [Beijerinckia indica]